MRRAASLIWWRDAHATLTSVGGYGVLSGFLALFGWSFVEVLRRNEGGFAAAAALWGVAVAPWLPALAALVSMRLFSEERQSGTLESLLTAPVRARDVVLGKFLAALTVVLLGLLLALVPVAMLMRMAPHMTGAFAPAALAAALAMLILQAAAWVAIGTCASLLARQQATAAVLAAVGIGLPYAAYAGLTSWIPRLQPSLSLWPPIEHVTDAATGLFALAPPVFYVSVTWCVLFVCVRLLESRDLRTR